jgi:hypothetical protein
MEAGGGSDHPNATQRSCGRSGYLAYARQSLAAMPNSSSCPQVASFDPDLSPAGSAKFGKLAWKDQVVMRSSGGAHGNR